MRTKILKSTQNQSNRSKAMNNKMSKAFNKIKRTTTNTQNNPKEKYRQKRMFQNHKRKTTTCNRLLQLNKKINLRKIQMKSVRKRCSLTGQNSVIAHQNGPSLEISNAKTSTACHASNQTTTKPHSKSQILSGKTYQLQWSSTGK